MTGVAGTPWYVNHYFTNGDTSGDATAATTAVLAFWAAVDGLQVNEVVGEVEGPVAVINPVNGEITGLVDGGGGAWQGDTSADALPIASQGLIQYRTATYAGGREVRGRTFVPGLSVESVNTNGQVISGAVAGLLAAGQALVDADISFCVYSPTNHLAAIVTNVTVPTDFAVLRSRRD